MSIKKWWNETTTKEKLVLAGVIVLEGTAIAAGGTMLYKKGFKAGRREGFGKLANKIYNNDQVVLNNDVLGKRMTITKVVEDLGAQ